MAERSGPCSREGRFGRGKGIQIRRIRLLAMHRHGFTEECYFDYTFSPIRNESGPALRESSMPSWRPPLRVIGERRTRLLRDLGEQLAAAQSVREVCAASRAVLSSCSADLPFCLIYLDVKNGSKEFLELAAAVSIDAGGPASPF